MSKCPKDCSTPKVLEIHNKECPVLFHKVLVPAAMGDDETNPPVPGKYRNVLLEYEANGHIWMYSSDGVPTFISSNKDKGTVDYEELVNKPSINDVELVGDVSLEELGITGLVETETDAREQADAELQNAIDDEESARIEADNDIISRIPVVNDATLTIQKNGSTVATFTTNDADNVTADISVPTKTSDLTNDSNFPVDANYVHTDNNYTTADKNKLAGIATGAEVNVQSDWNVTSTSSDAYIKNKPSIPDSTSDLVNDSGFITNSVNNLTNYYKKSETYTKTEVDGLIPTKTSDLTNDGADGTSTYVEADDLATVATSGSYNDLTDKPADFELVEMSYGESNAWAKFITAYQAKKIVYCRASSNSNPATGTQGRKAFMAYVNNAENPTEVEFQYVRSVSSKTASQPVDQVFVYKLTSANGGTWTVTTRDMGPKLANGTNTTVSYSNGTYTVNASQPTVPTKTSDLANDGSDGTSTYVEADELAAVATSGSYNDLANKPAIPVVNDATLTIQRNGVNVDTFTANASQNKSINLVVPTKTSDLTNDGSDNTAQYLETDETAYKTASIPYGECDSTSTATVFTATIPGITELRDGVCMWLKNGVVTSASGFTININGLGAKPVYANTAAASRETTIWNVAYTMLFVYDSTRVSGGCWVLYRGYDSNSIGVQLRTGSSTLPAQQTGYRYRLWLTSADGRGYVPINTSTATDTTTARSLNTAPIDPFGEIVYNSTNGTVNANANVPTSTAWQQYPIDIRYSYGPITLTYPAPVYLQCTPLNDGSAAMDDIVQTLPTSEDGKIYIYLGNAYAATSVELKMDHPVYYYKNGRILAWTGVEQLIDDGEVKCYSTSDGYTQVTNPTERTAPASVNQLLGNATQQTYSGKNLLVYPGLSGNTTINGVTFTQASDGKVVGSGTTTAGMNWYYVGSPNYWAPTTSGTYTLSFDGTIDNNGTVLYCYDRTDSTTAMRCTATQKSNTGTLTAGHLYQIYFNNGSAGKAVNVSGYAQLELGSTATDYEPYVGGTASPNPDYPQAVNVVTGGQTVKICGKNLLGGYSYDYNAGGAMATYHEDGTLSVAGTCTATAWSSGTSFVYTRGFTVRLPAGTYTFTASGGKETQLVSVLPDGTGETANASIPTGEGSRTFTTTTERLFYARIRVEAGATDYTVKFMLKKSATATDYEPYQGQEYEINLGKNLAIFPDGTRTYSGVTFATDNGVITANGTATANITQVYSVNQTVTLKAGQTYTISANNSQVMSGTYVRFRMTDGNPLSGTALELTSVNAKTTFTPSADTVGAVQVRCGSGSTYNNFVIKPQLETGSSATSFAPYFEPIELAKIGDYQDYIWNDEGTWIIHKEVGKVVLDGSESWNTGQNHYYLNTANAVMPSSPNVMSPVMSDYYTASSYADLFYARADYGVALHNTANRLIIRNKDQATVTDFKTWLSTHPTTVYYALAEAVDEEITNGTLLGELNAIGELYSGQNNIWLIPSAGAQGEITLCASLSQLPVATAQRLGAVMIGDGLSITDAGVLSAKSAPISLTLSYNTTGWSPSTMLEGLNISYDYNTGFGSYISSMDLAGAALTFTNDATGSAMPFEEVFNLLENGADIVLNNVPIGFLNDSSVISLPTPIMSGVRVSAHGGTSYQEDGSTVDVKLYTGVALALSSGLAAPFGFAIVRSSTDEGPDEYQFLVQGTARIYPPA